MASLQRTLKAVGFGLVLFAIGCSDSAGWKSPLDGSCTTHYTSRITVSDELVYASSVDGTLYAFALHDGKQIWTFQTGGGLTSGPEIITGSDDSLEGMVEATTRHKWRGVITTPILKADTVYFGSHDTFYASDASSGAMKWSFDVGEGIREDAVVGDRFVYFKAGGLYPDPQTIHALKLDDGSKAWAFRGQSKIVGPVLADGTIYLIEDGKALHAVRALDAESGKERWAFAFGTSTNLRYGATVSEDLLFFLGGGTVYALDRSSGIPVWQFENTTGIDGSRIFATREHLFFGTGLSEGYLYALNKKTGEPLWELALPGDNTLVYNAHFDEHLFVIAKSRLMAVGADSGEVIWKTRLGFDAVIESIVDGVVYASNRQTLIAVDSVTGKKLWKFATSFKLPGVPGVGEYCSPPTRAGELLLFSTSTKMFWGVDKVIPGHLYAIHSKTGKVAK